MNSKPKRSLWIFALIILASFPGSVKAECDEGYFQCTASCLSQPHCQDTLDPTGEIIVLPPACAQCLHDCDVRRRDCLINPQIEPRLVR